MAMSPECGEQYQRLQRIMKSVPTICSLRKGSLGFNFFFFFFFKVNSIPKSVTSEKRNFLITISHF